MVRIEIRSDSVLLDGYVNAVDRYSRPIRSVDGSFVEKILPKVFQRALDRADNVDLLLDHNKNRKLGSTKDGNLQLFEDNIGLRAICKVTDAEVIEKAKNDELRGWSFGFYSNKDSWNEPEGEIKKRAVEDLDITEVSIIDDKMIPIYIGTSIEKRGTTDVITETRQEDFRAVIEDMTKDGEIDQDKKKKLCDQLRKGVKIK